MVGDGVRMSSPIRNKSSTLGEADGWSELANTGNVDVTVSSAAITFAPSAHISCKLPVVESMSAKHPSPASHVANCGATCCSCRRDPSLKSDIISVLLFQKRGSSIEQPTQWDTVLNSHTSRDPTAVFTTLQQASSSQLNAVVLSISLLKTLSHPKKSLYLLITWLVTWDP